MARGETLPVARSSLLIYRPLMSRADFMQPAAPAYHGVGYRAKGGVVMYASRCARVLLVLPLLAGCALIPRKAEIAPPGTPPRAGTSGVVFCADGAGGLAGTTHVLQHTVANV